MRPRALVLRALGLGDFLAGVPALRALRRALADHETVLAAPSALAPLVTLSGAVDRLLPTGELESVPWSGPPPQIAVDLHGNGPASKAVLQALRPGRLVAFGGPGADGASVPGPAWDVDEHERDRWCRLVADAFGRNADPEDLLLPVPLVPVPARGAVVVHPGAASGARRWPAARYAAVAQWALAAGARVVVTGGDAERPLALQVCRLAGLPETACLAGRTNLCELAALVASARLVVCGDTGMAHLASAYRTPSVVLFGPTPPQRWGPPADGPHDAVWLGTAPGDPHAGRVDPALLRVTVPDVVRRASLRSGLPLGS
ncbi:glycosyltransferase family 9 protein [Nocardioides pantholopis]|uniref:glycosyltransferase family 9 protein n=1 Tax=Nocardioides pantholopis TaxID=2483798 RepID=UPI000F074C25|nr:glycosyltransferase family 9 protein [Nocardioides pantholopis]